MKVVLSALLFTASVCFGDVRQINISDLNTSSDSYTNELVKLLAAYGALGDRFTLDRESLPEDGESLPEVLDRILTQSLPDLYSDNSTSDYLDILKILTTQRLFTPTIGNDTNIPLANIPIDPSANDYSPTSLSGYIYVSSKLSSPTNNNSDRDILVLGAAKDITITGDLTINNVNYAEDQEDVDIETGGNLAIGTLSDLLIYDTNFSAGLGRDLYMYSSHLISAKNLHIGANISKVFMEAQTIDLTSLTFPAESRVMLRSKNGGLNFLTNQIGHINLSEVSHESINDGAVLTFADFTKNGSGYESVSRHPNGDPYIKIRSQGTIQDSEESEKDDTLTVTEKEEEHAPSFKVTVLGNKWYQHDQFGTFYDKSDSDWYYHLDHGWIYVKEWDDNGTWMYMPLVDETPIHSYMHFDGTNYTAVIKWDEFAAYTGLSLDFLKAIAQQSGTDPYTFTNEGNQTINVTDTAEPFGWVWTNSSTQNFLYNNRLEEWFYFNKDIPKTEARFYSYNQKCYVTPQEIRKRDYAPNIWKEMLSSYGFESFVNLGELNAIEVITDLDKDLLDGKDGSPIIISVNIPKTEIQEDEVWFSLIKTLTELQVDLKNYYKISEDENFYRLEIRNVFLNDVINSAPHESTHDINHEVDTPENERQASAKGLNDNGSKEAIALEKASLIDLNDDEQSAKVDYYIEVAVVASKMFEERNEERRFRRENWKPAELFVYDLVNNFDSVVDLTIEADIIGVKDDAMFDSLLEYAHNAVDVKEVVQVASTIGANDKESLESVFKNVSQADSLNEVVQFAADLGAQNKENLGSVFKNAYKADDLNEVMQVAAKALGTHDGSGNKKLGVEQASIMASTLQNADKADSLKSIIDDAASMGIQDATNLTSVFQNADQADNLKEVMSVAKQSLGSDNGTGGKSFNSSQASILANTLQNADKADSLKLVLAIAKDLGVQDEEHLTSVFVNAGNARDLITVCYAAVDTFGFDDGSGIKKLDSSKASILSSTLKNADKASQLKQVIEVSIELGINDAENLKPVFQNSDQATDLLEVLKSADEAGVKDKVTLAAVFQNADKANDLMALIEKTREINVQEVVELSKVLDSKDSFTNEEIATLLSSQIGSLEDSNLSLTVDSVIFK